MRGTARRILNPADNPWKQGDNKRRAAQERVAERDALAAESGKANQVPSEPILGDLATGWRDAFIRTLEESASRESLGKAATTAALGSWTTLLTGVIVATCHRVGWRAAAKGHRLADLPQVGEEYFGIDVLAFKGTLRPTERRWSWPVAAIELENSAADDRVAYSLWKVLCLRVPLRVVFAYRPDWPRAILLPDTLSEKVIGSIPVEERQAFRGETMLVMGSRGEGESFPWGYFKFWRLEHGIGKFARMA